jgi:signal transduction histidine kinase
VDAQKMAKIGSIANDFGVADKSWTDEIYSIFEIDNSKEITTEILIAQIHPEDRSYVSAICSNFHKQQSEGYDVNYRLLFPDGRIKYIHEQCKIVFDEHNKPIRSLSTIQDVTKEKIMEQDLLKNVKTDIISSVAHDVNNSLSAILAYSDVITTQLEHQQYDKAKASAEKMNLAGMAARTRVKKIQEVITATKVKEIGYIEFSLDTILRSFVDKDESK